MKEFGFDDNLFAPMMDDDVEFMPILSLEEDDDQVKIDYPETIAIMPLRNTVLFPGVVLPITVGREKSIKALQNAFKGNKLIGVLSQMDGSIEDPDISQIHRTGTIARVIKQLKMPDGSTTVIIQGKKRFVVNEYTTEEPFLQAKITLLEDKIHNDKKEFTALVSTIKDLASNIIKISPDRKSVV